MAEGALAPFGHRIAPGNAEAFYEYVIRLRIVKKESILI